MIKTIILIPSRLSATRLPRKPLLKINGISIISHVVKKAKKADIGEVYVATEDKEILEDVNSNGGKAIITNNKHKTGSDRIFECFEKLDLKGIDYIINLQGDEPLIDTNDIINLNKLAIKYNSEIATLATQLQEQDMNNPNIVKVVCDQNIEKNQLYTAKNFLRNIENDKKGNIFHHIGIYIFKVSVLKKFVGLKQSFNEINLKLEQLRALDNKIKIEVVLANSKPIGVDTEEDYIEIKKLMEYKS